MALDPLAVLVVEDQALVAMELQFLVEEAGHEVVGWATSMAEANALLERINVDLALVDVHLSDGPTGTDLAVELRNRDIAVVFMTANAKRVPDNFAGAIGIIAKPYTASGVMAALAYLHVGVRNPPPPPQLPTGLKLSPSFSARWT